MLIAWGFADEYVSSWLDCVLPVDDSAAVLLYFSNTRAVTPIREGLRPSAVKEPQWPLLVTTACRRWFEGVHGLVCPSVPAVAVTNMLSMAVTCNKLSAPVAVPGCSASHTTGQIWLIQGWEVRLSAAVNGFSFYPLSIDENMGQEARLLSVNVSQNSWIAGQAHTRSMGHALGDLHLFCKISPGLWEVCAWGSWLLHQKGQFGNYQVKKSLLQG